MSVNRYDASTGELTNIASGQRTWVGTQAAYKAAKQAGTLPNNAIIAITDDEQDHNHYSTDEVETGMYWIDGKPIYRCTFTATAPNENSTETVKTFTGLNQDIVMIDGAHSYFKNSNVSGQIQWRSMNDVWSNTLDFSIYAMTNTSTGELNFIIQNNGWPSNMPIAVTFEYTKTTDD